MTIFFVALISCSILIVLLRAVAHHCDLVDHPNDRKRHVSPTPTVGGIAMFLGVALALFYANAYTEKIILLMECLFMLVILGVLNDKYGLRVDLRMMIQVVLSLLIIVGGDGGITQLGAIFGEGFGSVQLGLWAIPFSLVAFVGSINAMNMIDGADGMAGKMALMTTLGVSVIFYHSGALELFALTEVVAGVLIGFLFFNSRIFVHRAWVFMGDAGSMWIGLILGWFMAQITRSEVLAEPALVLWLFGIPLIDTVVVMLRRIRRNQSPFAADRTHIHHVLEDTGFSAHRSVMILGFAQFFLVTLGVVFYFAKVSGLVIFSSFIILLLVYYLKVEISEHS